MTVDPRFLPLVRATIADALDEERRYDVWVGPDLAVRAVNACGEEYHLGTWEPATLHVAARPATTLPDVLLADAIVALVAASGDRVTPAVVGAYVADVARFGRDDSVELAHVVEDAVHRLVLAAVATGRCDEPALCAALAAGTRRIPFPRYYV